MLNTWEEAGVTEVFNSGEEHEPSSLEMSLCPSPPGCGRWFGGEGERLGLGQWARRLRWYMVGGGEGAELG